MIDFTTTSALQDHFLTILKILKISTQTVVVLYVIRITALLKTI